MNRSEMIGIALMFIGLAGICYGSFDLGRQYQQSRYEELASDYDDLKESCSNLYRDYQMNCR